MKHVIQSLHHVTATVIDAQEDLDFYAGLLGQRLVKKTVNFDNHHVFHFYYGSEHGTPGTLMTTFPYKGMGVRTGVHGAGQVSVTSFSVPLASLEFWHARLGDHGVAVERAESPFGDAMLRFRDPSGLQLQLVGNDLDVRIPWLRHDIDAANAVRGLFGVALLVRDPAASAAFLEEMLGATVLGTNAGITRMGVGGQGPAHIVDLVRANDVPDAVNGLGTVHHVAFAIGTDDEQLDIRETLLRRGVSVTDIRDRQYFHSIYFREPGGVLYEIATVSPGFTTDEYLAELGQGLMLPPWEEAHRANIEQGLPIVKHP